MSPDLFGQLEERFQKYQSAQMLQEFPQMVKLVGLTSKGFFLGITTSDLHAWQMRFSEKQLNFLRYAGNASGVDSAGIAILPPTPFSFEPDVDIDEGAIASKFYKGLGFGAAGPKRSRSSKFGRMARKAGGMLASLGRSAARSASRAGKQASRSISRAAKNANRSISRAGRSLSKSMTRGARSFSRGAKRTSKKILRSVRRAFR
jgi:hypothetical protein